MFTVKRWWGIRHVRWLYLSIRFAMWWNQMQRFFVAPNEADIRYLDAVWSGEA